MQQDKPNIALYGKIASGKSTVSNILCREHGYTRLSLAEPLKALASLAKDALVSFADEDSRSALVTLSELEDLSSDISRLVDPLDVRYAVGKFQRDLLMQAKPRAFLQYVGTDIFRAADPDCWVRHMLVRADIIAPAPWVCDDMRFLNEAQAMRERETMLVCCWLPESDRHKRILRLYPDGVNEDHISEHEFNGWDDDEWDAHINTGVTMLQQPMEVEKLLGFLQRKDA